MAFCYRIILVYGTNCTLVVVIVSLVVVLIVSVVLVVSVVLIISLVVVLAVLSTVLGAVAAVLAVVV